MFMKIMLTSTRKIICVREEVGGERILQIQVQISTTDDTALRCKQPIDEN